MAGPCNLKHSTPTRHSVRVEFCAQGILLLSLQALGQLMLTLACSVSAHAAALPSLDFAAQHHSPDLVRTIALLLAAGDHMAGGGGGSGFSWRHLWAVIGEYAAAEVDSLGSFNDSLVGARAGSVATSCPCVIGRLLSRCGHACDAGAWTNSAAFTIHNRCKVYICLQKVGCVTTCSCTNESNQTAPCWAT